MKPTFIKELSAEINIFATTCLAIHYLKCLINPIVYEYESYVYFIIQIIHEQLNKVCFK